MRTAELVLALTSTGLQALLGAILFTRGLFTRFPVFVIYTAFAVVSSLLGLAVRNHVDLYFVLYWTSEVAYSFLVFFSLNEIFRSVFERFYKMGWFRLIFPAIGIFMILIAVLRTTLYPSHETGWKATLIITLEITVGFLQIGLFCAFVVLVKFFRMRRSQYAFGLALGFGIEAAGSLVVFLLRSEFGTKFNPIVRNTPSIAYIIAVVVWLATFLKGEPPYPMERDPDLSPELMILELRRYTKTAKEILER